MKERPILFSSSMVKAILENRKTQTRRIVKPQLQYIKGTSPIVCMKDGVAHFGDAEGVVKIKCPFGQAGDRLWVRETWLQFASRPKPEDMVPENAVIDYRADYSPSQLCAGFDSYGDPYEAPKWKPSIHMPRWASRILLEITEVRVERLQEISEQDSIAEVMPLDEFLSGNMGVDWFKKLWNSLYNNWDENPFVWAITFKRIKP